MEFGYARELESFREEVRAFFREEMAPERTRGQLDPLDLTGYSERFERALLQRAAARGFLGATLPPEYGGGGKPLAFKALFDFEAAWAWAPAIDTPVTLIAPPLLAFGSAEQKQHTLPRIARGEGLACTAYSEPDAGSDLSRIATRARETGDGFVLDGHKSLVTGGAQGRLVLPRRAQRARCARASRDEHVPDRAVGARRPRAAPRDREWLDPR